MTRINLVPVYELSDSWLLAEYRELPRCIKQNINTDNAPKYYCLGTGHMKWARQHILFLLDRYREICNEMQYRGFTINYPYQKLLEWTYNNVNKALINPYIVTSDDLNINKQRLIEKYQQKPNFYKWTNRDKPKYCVIV